MEARKATKHSQGGVNTGRTEEYLREKHRCEGEKDTAHVRENLKTPELREEFTRANRFRLERR